LLTFETAPFFCVYPVLLILLLLLLVSRKITQNSIEVDAETKESTRKTEEKLGGRYKEGHERKKPK